MLFTSVAPVFTTRVMAVVLTGWGSDGTNGIQIVKHWGGTVIAQDEASSEVFEMPRSAITPVALLRTVHVCVPTADIITVKGEDIS
jgi:two-component system chemotaxis response regulator CheB